ncbi:PAS domain-containing protein [Luteibacter sp. PPL201]|uniref:histidine kinase n=1 Tax=Luteibacter sahnii TaxID=3021977 RepID=A0ABT6BCL8_9GAMM
MRDLPIFKQLLDLSQDCVKQLDLDGMVVAVNAPGVALLRLKDEHDLVGHAWVPMWPTAYQPVIAGALDAARAGERVHVTAVSELPGQGERWWSIVVGPLADADGRVTSLGAISREITERVQVERSLDALNGALRDSLARTRQQLHQVSRELSEAISTGDEANVLLQQQLDLAEMARNAAEQVVSQSQKSEAIGQIVVGMGHDFNNNLQIVLSALEAIPSVGELNPGQDRFLGFARAAAQHAALVSRRLLAFSRVHPFTPEHLDLATIVGEMVPLIRMTLGRDVAVTLTPAPEHLPTYADAHSIQQGLVNLCLNARDACQGSGTVAIRFGTQEVSGDEARAELGEGIYVFVDVEDDGTGMDEEVRERLFDPFFTTKHEGKGTGLGMTQVLAAVRQSGGGIDVQSTPGVGTRIRLLLPRAFPLETATTEA